MDQDKAFIIARLTEIMAAAETLLTTEQSRVALKSNAMYIKAKAQTALFRLEAM